MNAIERINFTLSNYYHDGYQKQNYPIHFSSDEQAKKVVAKILLDDVSQLTSANCTPEQSHWVLSTIKNRLVNILALFALRVGFSTPTCKHRWWGGNLPIQGS